jgi:cytochrome P450
VTVSDVFPHADLMDINIHVEGREMELFDRIRATDPVYWNAPSDLGPGFWSLTRYEDVRYGASEGARLSSAHGTQIQDRRLEGDGPPSLHNMDDPQHAKLRKLTIPHLRQIRIKQWQDVIDSSVRTVLDDAQAQDGGFDLVEVVSSRLPMLVLAQVLGVPAADAPNMVDWTNKLTSSDPDNTFDAAALDGVRQEALGYFEYLADLRRKDPVNDLISILVHAQVDGKPLSWGELAAYVVMLVAAGNETTRQLVSGGVMALDETPSAWDRLEADRSLLPSTIEEMLRYVSPIAGLSRTATEDLQIGGKTIRSGDKVVLWFSAANRDPEVFESPHEFRIDRTPNDHLTFGWGIHFCLGAHLARAEGTTFFANVLERGMRFEVTGAPQRVRHNIFRSWSSVPVRVVPSGRA